MPIEYRAEVIGSMLRPEYLKAARKQWEAGSLVTREFKRVEDRAVDEMLALQERCGVDVVTDGEMRRTHFIAPLTDVISGVKPIPAFTRVWRKPHEKNQKAEQTDIQVQYAVVDRIHRMRSLTNEEFAYARGRATKPLKVTLPSPLMMTLRWSPEYSRDAYPDPFALFRDAADIVRDEARELAALGCEYIQIDAPELGMLCDPDRRREDFADRGMDPAKAADRRHRHHQLRRRGPRRHLRAPSMPRQQQGLLRRRRRLRVDRPPGVSPRRQLRALPARVRRLALWFLRTARAKFRATKAWCLG